VASRCQQVELHPLPSGAVKEILTQQYKVEEQKAEVVARLSRGCLGWALSVIQDGVLLQERSQRLASLIDLSHAQSGQRLSYAAELALEFSKSRSQVDEVLSVWLSWWRDLLLIKGGNSQSITNIDYKSELFHQAEGYSLKRVRDFLHHLQATREQLEQNANPRLALEALMLSMPRYDKS
jgi:DNA polymerase-3 subunit delta'